MVQNVGPFDALLRIATGSFILTWSSRQTRWGVGTTLLTVYGAAKVAEGLTRYCPLNDALGVTTMDDETEKVVLRLGPLVYRRAPHPPVRTLWGVRPEPDNDESVCTAPNAIETSGWNWEGQSDRR